VTSSPIDDRQPLDLYNELVDAPLPFVDPATKRLAALTCAEAALKTPDPAVDLSRLLFALGLKRREMP